MVLSTAILIISLGWSAHSAPIEIPLGVNGYTLDFEILGLNRTGIAARELKSLQSNDPFCVYEKKLEGVYLLHWKMPAIGSPRLPIRQKRVEVYKESLESKGCTSAKSAQKAQLEAQKYFSARGFNLSEAIESKVLADESDFVSKYNPRETAECFLKKSCAFFHSEKDIQGKKIIVDIHLKAKSKCTQSAEDILKPGCAVDRLYTGNVTFLGRVFPFSFMARHGKQDLQHQIRGIAVYAQGTYKIVIFYFGRKSIGDVDDRNPVILRLS